MGDIQWSGPYQPDPESSISAPEPWRWWWDVGLCVPALAVGVLDYFALAGSPLALDIIGTVGIGLLALIWLVFVFLGFSLLQRSWYVAVLLLVTAGGLFPATPFLLFAHDPCMDNLSDEEIAAWDHMDDTEVAPNPVGSGPRR